MLSQSARRKLAEIEAQNMRATFGDAEAFAARLEHTRSMTGVPIAPPAFVAERVGVLEWAASDGSACFTLYPLGSVSPWTGDRHVLFFHGGGLVTEVGLPHWECCVELVERLGCGVTLPVYPLLPMADWKRAHACLNAVRADLAAKLGSLDRVIVFGDSAGGLLAISFAQLCVMGGETIPRALVTVSPMTDLSDEVDLAAKAALEVDDPLIGFAGLGQVPRLWIPEEGDRAGFPPCVLQGPMVGLPPQWMFAGSREALLPEMLEYVRRVEEAGSSIAVDVREGLWHDYPLMLDMDEGRAAFEQIADIMRTV